MPSSRPGSPTPDGDGQGDGRAAREPDPRFRLNPARLPRQIDLTLSPKLLERLEQLAARRSRSLDELVVELIDQQQRGGRR